jgi:single-strand DNA-binding protein
MAGVNKVILVGNLGKDPEIRHLDNGRAVTNFSLATSEFYKNKNGEKVTNTEWHNLVLWTPLAEIADKYLRKGNQIYVEGKLQTRSYDDKDGIKRYTTEVVVQNMTMLGSKNDGNSDSNANDYSKNSASDEGVPAFNEETDDLPF